ncbi:MAG TPA: hypothetical protein GXX20_12540 [Clostridiaceae bacterium]|nr:hypothetical protein [Clostridiaceae bacterium]
MPMDEFKKGKQIYKVVKISEMEGDPFSKLDSVPKAHVDCYPWSDVYTPEVYAQVFYTESRLCVFFKAYEPKITATYLNTNDPVYKDSCVEFFFNPYPEKDKRYINLEMNPFGTFLIMIGEERNNRPFITDIDPKIFQIKTSVTPETLDKYNGKYWTVQYSIPFTFIEKYYGKIEFKSGYRMEANLYKCGDCSHQEHYGCWNPILIEKPDFHRPDYFGDFILE